jgi:sulfide:quinone oxidoreductase
VNVRKKEIESVTGDTVSYDLLISIPPHFGAQVLMDSGLGDPMGFVNTNQGTLQAADFDNIYVIGDATNVENIVREIAGAEPRPDYDGHST